MPVIPLSHLSLDTGIKQKVQHAEHAITDANTELSEIHAICETRKPSRDCSLKLFHAIHGLGHEKHWPADYAQGAYETLVSLHRDRVRLSCQKALYLPDTSMFLSKPCSGTSFKPPYNLQLSSPVHFVWNEHALSLMWTGFYCMCKTILLVLPP